jgi:predicted PurR-regulated permease PerM
MPILLTLGPIALYLFSYGNTTMAAGILIWGIILSFVDTPLRAIFFGRGSKTPMPIIFFGSIGGMIQAGIIGLFIGAVVLTLGYNLFFYWLKDEQK